MFELKLNNKTIQLKWGTWAIREYCIARGIEPNEYFSDLSKSDLDIDKIIKMVYAGYKSACVSNKQEIEYTEADACDWIDEEGSIFNPDSKILVYLRYIIDNTITTVQGVKKEEKKKPNKIKLG